MHTSKHKTPRGEIYVTHNSDWSGEAYVAFPGHSPIPVDARAFLNMCKAIAADETKSRIISFIESMEDEDAEE